MNNKNNNKYVLIENNKVLHKSCSLEKLINYTAKDNTKDALIYYNNVLVWVQNPSKYYNY